MHKTFISYHHDGEQDIKDEIVYNAGLNDFFIDKSVGDGEINVYLTEDTIMSKIRHNYIQDASVIVVLIGYETSKRPYVNSEIQAGLWGDNPVGLIGVVRDEIYDKIYDEDFCNYHDCNCGASLNVRNDKFRSLIPFLVNKNNLVLENKDSTYPHYKNSDAYCSIYKYSDFMNNIRKYIDEAYEKRYKSFDIRKRNEENVETIGKKFI
ncbi:uncharacterized protein RZ70_06830 [Apilactobacillus kunkeei]|uniref:TIR domain-containing protein n=1 Tax=Apilactobacillus kunkeei TaxID=148814 RepID=UPI0006BF5612|nr:TIR domain-containing protein [Apilactobacillus kunkeei]KOY72818.1 uncharacterized protein RZ70_06830 [Apilactobacillus kunkeei]